MTGDTDTEYDPESPTPPERESPHRSTAPQGEFTSEQVAIGLAVVTVGVAITVTLPLILA